MNTEEEIYYETLKSLTILLVQNYDANIDQDIVENAISNSCDEDCQRFIYDCLSFPDCVDPSSSFMLNNIDKFVDPDIPEEIVSKIKYLLSN